MRFSLFAHMERWDESVSHEQAFQDLTDLTLLAEEGGFSTVWIGEHHSMEFTASPNPLPQLAYLAAKTSKIRLGAGTVIAPFWDPIRAAGECALLDVISNGRMEVGIARGAYQFEFDRMTPGLASSDGGTYLRELVPAIQRLWEGDYAHDGEHWQFPTSTSVPKPIQQPNPPMWIAARDPNTHDFAIANGCNIMVTPLMNDDDEVIDLKRKFDGAVANNPQATHDPELMVLRHTYIHPESEPEGWRAGAEAISKYFRTFAAWGANDTTPTNGFLSPKPVEDFDEGSAMLPDSLRKAAMIGTPEEVIARLKTYEEMGIHEFGYWVDNSMTHDEKRASLKLFIDHVVPAFQ